MAICAFGRTVNAISFCPLRAQLVSRRGWKGSRTHGAECFFYTQSGFLQSYERDGRGEMLYRAAKWGLPYPVRVLHIIFTNGREGYWYRFAWILEKNGEKENEDLSDTYEETWVWALGREDPLEDGMATPVFLAGESHGQRSLVGYSPWGRKEWDLTEGLTLSLFTMLYSSGGHIPNPRFYLQV